MSKVAFRPDLLKQYFGVYWRGMAMGAADVVPGVSGGTIALISGIYSRLIFAIGAFRPALVKRFFVNTTQQGVLAALRIAWQEIDGSFLTTLFAGILTSIILLARIVSAGLSEHPIWIWSFFFGLIISSAVFLAAHLASEKNKPTDASQPSLALLFFALLSSALFAWWLTHLPPIHGASEPSFGFVVLCASIAMCAMILPGISGSFILLLLGVYQPVLEAVNSGNVELLFAFVLGAAMGLLSFVQLLKYLLARYQALLMTVMLGFLLGSASKVWPWKETLSYNVNRHGELIPAWQVNVSPLDYSAITAASPELMQSFLFMFSGLLIGVVIGVVGRR